MRIRKSIYQKVIDGKQKTITCSKECANKVKKQDTTLNAIIVARYFIEGSIILIGRNIVSVVKNVN